MNKKNIGICKLNELKGCRTSKNREMVLEILQSADMPITVDNLYLRLREENKNISLSTIYRILEKLTVNNIVTKTIIMDDNKARYELMGQGHRHYLICTKCNDMIPINSCPVSELEKNLQENTGFNIQGHKLEVYGQCARCRK